MTNEQLRNLFDKCPAVSAVIRYPELEECSGEEEMDYKEILEDLKAEFEKNGILTLSDEGDGEFCCNLGEEEGFELPLISEEEIIHCHRFRSDVKPYTSQLIPTIQAMNIDND